MSSIFDNPNYLPLEKVAGKIAINVRGSTIAFSKQLISKLRYPKYVQIFVNNVEKKLAMRVCNEFDDNALKFVPADKKTVNSIRWNNPAFTKSITALVPESCFNTDFTCTGEFYEDEDAVLFDMNEAIPLSK